MKVRSKFEEKISIKIILLTKIKLKLQNGAHFNPTKFI